MKRRLRRRYGRSGSSRGYAGVLRAHAYYYWKAKPTLGSGHFDDLKFDDGKHRVWVSRASRADYDSYKDYLADRLTVEMLVNGRWERV